MHEGTRLDSFLFTPDAEMRGPVPLPLDPADLPLQLGSLPPLAVIALRLEDLRTLRSRREIARLFAWSAQNRFKGLQRSFGKRRHVAIEGKYATASRLQSSIVEYLKQRASTHSGVHLIGVEDAIFDGLRAHVERRSEQPQYGTDEWRRWAEEQIERRFPGDSSAVRTVRSRLLRSCEPKFARATVLLLGPSGVGKTTAARILHDFSRGAEGGPLVVVNSPALNAGVAESELFGIEAGVATGVAARRGQWHKAHRGTLFFEEVADLPLDQQAKLLSALDGHGVRSVGGDDLVRAEVRVVCATNRSLPRLIAEGRFREDLFQRLNQMPIHLPALVERRGDIESIAQKEWSRLTGSPRARLTPELIDLMLRYDWPGNIRELEHLLLTLHWLHDDVLSPSREQLFEAWRERNADFDPDQLAARPRPALVPVAAHPTESRLRAQVAHYKSVRGDYESLERVLEAFLEIAAKEHAQYAFVETRTKSVARVAEKIRREGLTDVVAQLCDLCGGRVVVDTDDELRAVSAFLERYFEIDRARSQVGASDTAIAPGFSSVSYVVRLHRARTKELAYARNIEIPEEAWGLWAEVQVRTKLKNAWLDTIEEMGRDIPLLPPPKWAEEMGDLARVLRAVDQAFSCIRTGFDAYRTSYPSYLSAREIEREIEILETVLECDPDPRVAVRLGKLAIRIEAWDRAIRVLEGPAAAGYQPALRDLGVVLCQKHRGETKSAGYRRGQDYLTRACDPPHRDVEALCSLAGTWKRAAARDAAEREANERRALEFSRRAFAIDPADPYALGGVLESELVLRPDVDIVTILRSEIDASIERCREQIAARVQFPWAFFSLGRFLLLLGEVEEGLHMIELAIEHCTSRRMLQSALESYERMSACGHRYPGLERARERLAAAHAAWKGPRE